MNHQEKKKRALWTALAACITVFHLIPFYILLTTALKAKGISARNGSSLTKSASVISQKHGIKQVWPARFQYRCDHSCFGGSVDYDRLSGGLSLARRRTKLNQAVYFLFIGIMIIPPLTSMVPLYKMVVEFGMLNTLEIAILNNTAAYMPLTIFLYAGFIRSTIPKELEEAARIDGASTAGIFFRIVFPLLKPVTATICIIACVFIWNDYQFSIFFLQDKSVQTLTVAIAGFFGQNANNLHLVAAASLMAMLPMTILFLFLQKYFIKGLSAGALKG